MKERQLRRPVIDPLLMALKSRRVIVALSALVVSLLVMAVPELATVRGEILTLLVTLTLAVIGGYTVEEAARAGQERAVQNQDELRELIREVLGGMTDELVANQTISAESPIKNQIEE